MQSIQSPIAAATAKQRMTDTRSAQAARVAAYLELFPGATAKEIDAFCDVGSVTKVLSEMQFMGYGLGKAWRNVCANGKHPRRVRTYVLLYRPTRQPDLFRTA